MADDPVAGTMEKVQGHVTLALTVAARIMEVQAHRRSVQLRDAQRQSLRAVHEVEQQQRAEAAVTRDQLRDVGRKEWWDTARPEDVATAYATARAYAPIDLDLARTAQQMEQEIQARYGVDADQLVRDTARTDAWMTAVVTDVGMSTSETTREAVEQAQRRARSEAGEAVALVAEANAVDNLVHADGVVTAREAAVDVPAAAAGWDEAGRREALAARLDKADVPSDAQTARLTADQLQARPASVSPAAHGHGKPPRAKNGPAVGQERVRGR